MRENNVEMCEKSISLFPFFVIGYFPLDIVILPLSLEFPFFFGISLLPLVACGDSWSRIQSNFN
jgi:hypothetical protein